MEGNNANRYTTNALLIIQDIKWTFNTVVRSVQLLNAVDCYVWVVLMKEAKMCSRNAAEEILKYAFMSVSC